VKCLPDWWQMQKPSKHRIIHNFSHIDTSALAAIMFVLSLGWYFATGLANPHHGLVSGELPRVTRSVPMRSALREDAIIISVRWDGRICFPSFQCSVSADALPKLIREKLQQGSERRVFIRADARAKFGNVRHILEAVQIAQVEKVSFLAWRYVEQPTNILRPE
jgi:biopolymer transport protein TolR